MKVHHLIVAGCCISAAVLPCSAQVHTDSVDIGLDGIHVHTADGQKVDIGLKDGIQINTNKGARVNLGKRGPITGNTVSVQDSSNATTTVTTQATSSRIPLAQRVSIMEQQVAGKTSEGIPLAERVAQLEKNNLGHVGTGPLHERVQVLIRELGVQMPAVQVQQTIQTAQPPVHVHAPAKVLEVDASDDEIEISNAGENGVVKSNGKRVSISGAENRITISGGTPKLSISGAGNSVFVEAVDHVDFSGTGNRVVWKAGFKTDHPRVSDSGSGNSIVQGNSR